MTWNGRITRALFIIWIGVLVKTDSADAITVSYDGQYVIFAAGGNMVKVGPAGTEILAAPAPAEYTSYLRNNGVSVTPTYTELSGLSFADFSGDSRTTIWTGSRICYTRLTLCFPVVATWSSVETPDGKSTLFSGSGVLSSNGRYILGSVARPFGSRLVWLQDLLFETQPSLSESHSPCKLFSLNWDGRQVSNNGSGVCIDDEFAGLMLLKPTEKEVVTPDRKVQYAAIDASGSSVVYVLGNNVFRYDVQSKKTRLVYATGAFVFGLQLSDDGKTALVPIADQQYGDIPIRTLLIAFPAGEVRQLAFPLDRNPCLLSGDGKIAMCFTDDDDIYRVELSTGTTTVFPWKPAIVKIGSGVPGSIARIRGYGFPDRVATPAGGSAWELAGTRVLIDGYPAPVVSSSVSELVIQVPWELSFQTGRRVPIVIDPGNGHLAEALFDVLPQQILFEKTAYGEILGTRQNTDIEVGTDTPANPGDIVSLKVLGLGPVDQPLLTGHPGPAGPFARTTSPVTCGVSPSFDSLVVYYAGMTPNEVGTYRIVLQIPEGSKASYQTASGDSFDLFLRCRAGDSDTVSGKFAVKIIK